MRVLQVLSALPPPHSGTASVAVNTSVELRKRGHEVAFLSTTRDPLMFELPKDVQVVRGAALLRMGMAGLLENVSCIRNFDLVHLHLPFIIGGDQVVRASLRYGKRLVATYYQDLFGPGLRQLVFPLYTQMVIPGQLNKADALVVPSLDYAKQSILSGHIMKHRRLAEIPCGVNTTFFIPGIPRKHNLIPWSEREMRRTFLFVGTLDRAHFFKGVEVLIEAISQLHHLHCRVVIVGEGSLRRRYQALAQSRGVADRVLFTGRVDANALLTLYRSTICTVLPSTTTGEIFGVTLLEAMACGKPTIASNLPGVRTVLDDNRTGILVPPRDAEALAAAMETILDPETQEEMGARGREKAIRSYDWSHIGELVDNLYRQIAR